MTIRRAARPLHGRQDLTSPDTSDMELPRRTRTLGAFAIDRWVGGRGALAAVVCFVMLATGARPWRLFARGPFTSDFYDVQGRALSRLRLSVPPDVAAIEGFVLGDETHLYFGVIPAVARIPLVAWGDWLDGRLVLLSMTIAVLVGALTVGRLVVRAADDTSIELPTWGADVAAAAFGVATPVLWLASRALVYHEAEIWGVVLALLGCERVLIWWDSGSARDLAIAGALALVALNTRASSGAAPVIALALLAAVLLLGERRRDALRPLGFVLAAGAFYAAINFARFDSLFSVPFDSQVTTVFSERRRTMLAQTGGSFFSPRFVLTCLWQYVRPDAVRPDLLFPFVDWGPSARVFGGAAFDTVDRAGSVTTTMPVLLVGAAGLRWGRVPAAWRACLIACAVATFPTLAIGFVAHRYLLDFVPLFVLLAALGSPRVLAWRFGRHTLAVAACAGAIASIGLGLLAQRLYLLPAPSVAVEFVQFRYDIYDAYGSDPPPGLRRYEIVPAAGADGEVALVGDCDAVLLGTGDDWSLLETRLGGAYAVALVGRPHAGELVTGDGWMVQLMPVDGGLRLQYTDGEHVMDGDTLPDDERQITLDVVSGPGSDGVQIRDVDGRVLLHGFLLADAGPLRAAPGWRSVERPAVLCQDLATRLG